MKQFLVFASLALMGSTAPATSPRVDASAVEAVVVASGIETGGDVLVSKGSTVILASRFQTGKTAKPSLWRWASITKQIVATLVMQEVAAGHIDLDKPISLYLPAFKGPTASRISVRQLLRHQSGLPNPSDMPEGATGVPDFYKPGYPGNRSALTGFCAGTPVGLPSDRWSYNNCDYIVAGALLERVTGKPWATLVAERITRPLGMKSVRAFPRREPTVAGFEDGKPESPEDVTAYQASAGLSGTIDDLWKFDRALITGKLLPDAQRAEMWDGQPKLGFIALGQWVFTVPLKGCAAPVRIVERRGQIGGVEVRNFILPDRDVVAIAFVNRSGFDFGEVWQGKGFSYDLLSAAACP